MESRTFRLLDFPRVLQYLSGLARSTPGRNSCLGLKPFQTPDQLQEATALLHEALEAPREVFADFQGFPDLQGFFTHIDQGNVGEEDGFWAINHVLDQCAAAKKTLETLDPSQAPRLASFFASCPWPEKSVQALKRCLNAEGEIKDDSSPELLQIRQELRALRSQCTKKIDSYLVQNQAAPYLQDNYLTLSADRYVLAVKSNFKGRFEGIIHDYSQTGETCYLEPLSLVELNNRLQELKQEERQEKIRVLRYLTSLIRQEQDAVRAVYAHLVHLDVLYAKKELAGVFEGVSLRLGGSEIRLLQARHPLLYWESEHTSPINIELDSSQQGLILSGGNAGGKTVALKTLGLIALMALSAIPVPVQADSRLPRFEKIHPFFGDEQSLDENLSTFTAQINQLVLDWPSMDAGSLVLLDEFGAGTDPSQGAALAQAILDQLRQKQVRFMAATHFPALKAYGLGTQGVRAASVLFEPQTRKPLYTIAYDQVGQSQALDVAREQGLPWEILKQAEEYLLLDGEDSGQLLNRLNTLAVEREHELHKLQQEREKLFKDQQQWKTTRNRQLQALIDDIQGMSRTILQEWREGKAGRKQALKELERLKKDLSSHIEPEQPVPDASRDWTALHKGRPVQYLPWKKNGTIQEKDEKKQQVKLDLGGISIWAAPEEIGAGNVSKAQSEERGSLYKTGGEASGLILDVRGLRSDEAEASVRRYLDQALLQGRDAFTIIHGKGTGALRQVVKDTLQRHEPQITDFYLAPEGQGGDGATIVTLKRKE